MKKITISDLENFTGIKKHTIRIWERRYQLLTPERSNTNIRYYSLQQLESLLNISILCRQGFKISELSLMNATEIKERIVSLNHVSAFHDKAVKELLLSLLQMDTDNFEFILDSCCTSLGNEETLNNIILPFLERAGLFWHAPNINSLQNHFINFIREKLYISIEKAKTARTRKQQTCMMFLSEGTHDLPLLYNYYLLLMAGFKVIYLGVNNSIDDVEYAARLKQPAFIITCKAGPSNRFNMQRLDTCVSRHLPGSSLIVLNDHKNLIHHLDTLVA